MKKATTFVAAAALALSASAAIAGNNAAPAMENEIVIVPEEAGSSVGILPIALLGLLLVGVAASSSGGHN